MKEAPIHTKIARVQKTLHLNFLSIDKYSEEIYSVQNTRSAIYQRMEQKA